MSDISELQSPSARRAPVWVFATVVALLIAAIVFLAVRSTGESVIATEPTADESSAESTEVGADTTTGAADEAPDALAFETDSDTSVAPKTDSAPDANAAPSTGATVASENDSDSTTQTSDVATTNPESTNPESSNNSVVADETPTSEDTAAPGTSASPTTTASPATTTAPTTAAPATTAVPTTTTAPTTTTTEAPAPASGGLYADPYNSAAIWAANNPGDSRADVIAEEIGAKPIARWFGDWNGNVTADVQTYVAQAANAGAVPTMVVYNIPDRDCGQHSSGGAASYTAYENWIDDFADGLGDNQAIIVLEPDSIALNGCAGSQRNQALSSAIVTIKDECDRCQVYLDAGHSNWVGASDMADRLRDAGVLNADGFFTNVSNYYPTSNEAAFGQQVLSALGNPSGLGQVIDVSRNGNGANGEWCDPSGRAIGSDPTLNTRSSTVHAHLWIKVPGEADGCIAGAGQFVPDRAYELATS